MHSINKKLLSFLLLGLTFTTYAKTPQDTLIIAHRIDEMTTLDPAEIFEFAGLEYATNTYQRLIKINPKDLTKIEGMAAYKWEISKDGKTYTFHLNNNLKFANSHPLTAEDVAFSLSRAISLGKAPSDILVQLGFTKDNIHQTIKVINPYTIQLTFNNKYSPNFILYCLSTSVGSIVDKNEVLSHEQNNDLGNNWLKNNHAGSGAYQLKQWKASEILSLTKNEHYPHKEKSLKRIIIRNVKESSTQQLLLTKEDIDIARNLEPEQLNKLHHKKMVSSPKAILYYLGLNQKNRYLRIPEVRLAIKYLIDYHGILNAFLKHQAFVHQGFIPKGISGSYLETPFHLNIQKAKDLLKQADLEDGFSLSIETNKQDIASSLQDTFAKANIKLSINPSDSKQALTIYRNRKHDIFIGMWGADYPDPHNFAATFTVNNDNSDNSPFKTIAWRNAWLIPDLTRHTQLALLESEADKRAKLYYDLQKDSLYDSPTIIMFQQIETAMSQPAIKGFELGFMPDSVFYEDIYK
ncbi:MAG: transporter substrate-binding protein [Francisellaceae bacterium]|nr:transporter substrate-binding protein [Francisellaceae bacterium]